jgi:polysaccharide biosynthesis/export protein
MLKPLRLRILSPLFPWLLCIGTCAAADVRLPSYTLHAGDHILVGIYDDPKMKPVEVVVTPDGRFSFPLVGTVVAAGKDVDQLRSELETRLRRYVTAPVVTLTVTDVRGNVAYVIGQVNKPGEFIMNPRLTILQALSLAGGFNPYAKVDRILVIRNSVTGQQVLKFRYGDIAGGNNLDQNVELDSGDVVVVP